ncbi:MAG: hypothetical protein V4792_18550, partial [Pseudomonadota bacterium]
LCPAARGIILPHDCGMAHDADEITQRVLRFTYDGLVNDAASFAGISLPAARALKPRRFSSHIEVERMRAGIKVYCTRLGADDELAEYLSTRWLEQFRPLAM